MARRFDPVDVPRLTADLSRIAARLSADPNLPPELVEGIVSRLNRSVGELARYYNAELAKHG